MVKRMLIDATHPEETRVVVLDGTRLEEFDVETSTKKQNKSNIYLAKVVRVEPSLQAAFVDYGGNRHGFLAFSEIHPDYYQIPVADRERLLAEVQRHAHHDDEEPPSAEQISADQEAQRAHDDAYGQDHGHDEHDHAHDHDHGHTHDHDHAHDHAHDHDQGHENHAHEPGAHDAVYAPAANGENNAGDDNSGAQLSFLTPSISSEPVPDEAAPASLGGTSDDAAVAAGLTGEEGTPAGGDDFAERPSQVEEVRVEERPVDVVGGSEDSDADDEDEDDVDDDEDSKRRRRFLASRHYKIQEVIKRRQIMLVQVVKEERGNKGAALTTYLSLAGRYCVLMPNSSRGGGVSRKITNATDRRRLKSIMAELQPPKTAAVILRTAGAERSKPEIKRDYEYLMRTWDQIRENTLQSRAPALIHEEGNLIKRAIRDVYSKDIEDVLVEGEEGYKTAKDFMRMLTPSHSKKVQRYDDKSIALFQRYQVETQLEAINTPVVQLRSGGSIVFGQTEALVAIDVNSGRATRERHIEETALKTNLEAADEIARQLRLRDLAGLVVIDFIDMEENRNNHAVERRLKEALKLDRARIQVGRISHFGLLELSRQRLRPSLIETNFRPCSHCGGTGLIRSTESASIYALRMIEEEGIRRRSSELTVTVHPDVALYLLNYKREQLASLEQRYGVRIFVLGDPNLIQPNLRIDRVKATRAQLEEVAAQQAHHAALAPPAVDTEPEVEEEFEAEEEEVSADENGASEQRPRDGDESEDGRRGRGGRRRRRRRGRGRDGREGREPREHGQNGQAPEQPQAEGEFVSDGEATSAAEFMPEGGETHAEGAPRDAEGGEPGRDGTRRRRGRRGGRRRRREGGEQQSVHGDQTQAGQDLGDTPPEASFGQPDAQPYDGDNGDAPASASSGEDAAPRKRGFFSAIKETALSWTRNDGPGDEPAALAQTYTAAPQPTLTPPPSPPPAPHPLVAEPVVPAPQPQAAPPPPPPAPPVEEVPAGPPRKGWWSQPKV